MAAASSTMAAARPRCCRRSIDAVAGRAKVIVDGSFSRGSDIVKAIAMGADWVGLGRLYCYGLAAAGAAGIERVIELLEEEMREAMGLLGVTSLKQLDKSYISRSMPTNLTGVHSAFRCSTSRTRATDLAGPRSPIDVHVA